MDAASRDPVARSLEVVAALEAVGVEDLVAVVRARPLPIQAIVARLLAEERGRVALGQSFAKSSPKFRFIISKIVAQISRKFHGCNGFARRE